MATSASFITTTLVKQHLKEMGYDPKSLSTEALKEFVLELQDIYSERLLKDSRLGLDSKIYQNTTDTTDDEYFHSTIEKSQFQETEEFNNLTDQESFTSDMISLESELDLEKWQEQVDEMTEEQLLNKLRQINLSRVENNSAYIEQPIRRPLYQSKCNFYNRSCPSKIEASDKEA